VLRKIDCILLRAEHLEAAMAYYQEVFGLRPLWRSGLQVGLGMPETDAEIVLHSVPDLPPEAGVHFLVDDVTAATEHLRARGCTIVVEPFEIAIGQCVVLTDPFGNRLHLLDKSKGSLPAGFGLASEAPERDGA
jgi:predicted enzyme related to lactoylglutathione lyase